MQIIKYNPELIEEWSDFVRKSKNGTFLFDRSFMDYHADRFVDHSLMFYEKNKIVALLPANIGQDHTLYSHQGLTYGGFILDSAIKAHQVIKLFDDLIKYLKEIGIRKIIYKAIPHIYHKHPSEEDLYALSRFNAQIHSRLISSVIDLNTERLPYAQLRKRQTKKAINTGITVSESDNLNIFWEILESNLLESHNTKPIHSISEISKLKQSFNKQIRLFTAEYNNKILAGCLIFETETVAHVQYISANNEGKQLGALDMLFDKLISDYFKEKKYFDFGTSNENNGLYLNEGLISQKEGFGARGIVYDTYIINI